MILYDIYIDITDVSLSGIEQEVMRYAAKDSIKLIYEGADNKFTPLNPSRLEFTLEVNVDKQPNTDLYYEELFTGDEERFRVEVKNADNNRILWSGFLLPEVYQEPYDRSTFYVNFAATDGLGKLKGLYFPDEYFKSRNSVMKLIAECLRKTGLELPINIAPGIVNAAENNWENIYVNGEAFGDENGKTDCYEILEALLKITGSTLQQERNAWYIVGWQFKGGYENFLRYNPEGKRIQQIFSYVETDNLVAKWEMDIPNIGLKPPFKEVKVTTEYGGSHNIFPEDFVEQIWGKPEKDLTPPIPKYWKGVVDGIPNNQRLKLGNENVLNRESHNIEEGKEEVPLYVTFLMPYDGANENTQQFVDENYIYTNLTPFVSTHKYLRAQRAYIDVEYEFEAALTIPYAGYNERFWQEDFQYELLCNGQVLLSNRPGVSGNELQLVDFEEIGTSEYDGFTVWNVKGTIFKKGIPLFDYGNVEFRIYNTILRRSKGMMIKRLAVIHNSKGNTFVKNRNIKYSSKESYELKISDSSIERVSSGLIYQKPIPENELIKIQGSIIEMKTPENYGNVFRVNDIALFPLVATFYKKLLRRKAGSDFFEHIKDVRLISFGFPSFRTYLKINNPDGSEISDSDEIFLWINQNQTEPQSREDKINRERWCGYQNTTGIDRLGYVIDELIHSINPKPILSIEGTAKGIVFPRTMVNFKVKGIDRTLIPVRTAIDFNSNISRLLLIEKTFEKIEDYGEVDT